jgi:hypothetical protein
MKRSPSNAMYFRYFIVNLPADLPLPLLARLPASLLPLKLCFATVKPFTPPLNAKAVPKMSLRGATL